MDIVMYIMLVLAAIFIGGVIYIFYKDGRNEKEKGLKNKDHKDHKDKIDKKDYVVNDSQHLLEFEGIEVLSDDVALLKKNNNTYIGVMEISGINFNLLSDIERISLEDSFAELLNGLDYPLQLFVQSKKIDLENYMNAYKNRISILSNELRVLKEREIRNTGEGKKIGDLEIMKKQNQVDYGNKLLEYFVNKTDKSNLLERKYYAVFKYKHNSNLFVTDLSNEETLYAAYNDIYNRAVILMDTLGRNNLNAKLLNGLDLGEFIYSCYNKDDSSNLKFRNVMKSKYDSLCTTATPVELKYIDNAIKEVKDLKNDVDKKIIENLENDKAEEL